MQIEFLGTAGPMSVPRPLCNCDVCQQARERGVPYSRSGPGIFIHGPDVLLDTSEDINFQINRSKISKVRAVFYSHWHPDHVMGRRVLESLNANYVNHPPKNTQTDVFLPEQVGNDFDRFLGSGDHLRFYKEKGWIHIHVLKDGESVTLNGAKVTPIRLAERFAYGLMIEETNTKVVIVPDELRNWEPSREIMGLDLAVLPIGVFEDHPLTGEKIVPTGHPVTKEECLFPQTMEVIRKLNAKRTILTHINGFSFDELKEVEKRLQAEGINVTIAYDTLLVAVGGKEEA